MNDILSKKIIVFDLDGTLAESKQVLGLEMAELLARLAGRKKVAVISGGSYRQFQKQFLPTWREILNERPAEEVQSLNENLFLLPTSGSQIYAYDQGMGDWQILAKESFPAELKEKTEKAFETVIASGDYDIPKETYGERLEDRGTQITFSALGQDAPLEKKKIWDPDQAKRQKIKKFLEQEIPEADISIGGATSIDVLPKGFNKAVGLQKLLGLLFLEKDGLIFVGDALFPGGNDYSAFVAGFETVKVKIPSETSDLIGKFLS
jgi:HAD superfamily hydrolase (TIGR01484 family)